jgi:hypothetical protein
MAAVTYNTENLIAGQIQTDQVQVTADTYYRGMPLTYDASAHYYKYSAAGASLHAIYLGDGLSASRIVGQTAYDTVIMPGSEVMEGGFVNDSGAALTLDNDYIAAASLNGFSIKRS